MRRLVAQRSFFLCPFFRPFIFFALKTALARIVPQTGCFRSFPVVLLLAQFAFAKPEPLNQRDVARADKITSTALDTVKQPRFLRFRPQTISNIAVECLRHQQGRADTCTFTAIDTRHLGLV